MSDQIKLRFRLNGGDFAEAEAGLARELGSGYGGPSLGGRIAGFVVSLFPVTVTLDAAGVHQGGGVARAWSDFAFAFETPNLIVLVITQTSGLLTLPKRGMSPSHLETVRALVMEHVARSEAAVQWVKTIRLG